MEQPVWHKFLRQSNLRVCVQADPIFGREKLPVSDHDPRNEISLVKSIYRRISRSKAFTIGLRIVEFLWRCVMQAQQPMRTLRRFFSGLAEHTFEIKLGIVDPPLIDYLSELLVQSVRMDQLHHVRTPRGHLIQELGLMLVEAEQRIGSARRSVHRYIGDFALFWAGLFPEYLRQTHSDADIDRFGQYCLHGKRAYLIASSIEANDEEAPPSDILERLGLEFEMCAYGLREVRREWEDRDEDTTPLIA